MHTGISLFTHHSVFILTIMETSVLGNHYNISASADGGPRSWVCTRETLHSAPHQH